MWGLILGAGTGKFSWYEQEMANLPTQCFAWYWCDLGAADLGNHGRWIEAFSSGLCVFGSHQCLRGAAASGVHFPAQRGVSESLGRDQSGQQF